MYLPRFRDVMMVKDVLEIFTLSLKYHVGNITINVLRLSLTTLYS